jgi:CO/xanthine dehydrogenase Mo-binding subunit
MTEPRTMSRRGFVHASGAIVVSFAWPFDTSGVGRFATIVHGDEATVSHLVPPGLEPPLDQADSWLSVHGDGSVTLSSGKVELGTGVQTALSQIVAEELNIEIGRVTVVQSVTGRTPNQGSTTGSKTLQNGGPAIRRAAATARAVLLARAAERLGVRVERLVVTDGVVSVTGAPGATVSYAVLVGDGFHRTIDPAVTVKPAAQYKVVGQPVPRVELPAKIAGTHAYVHNVRVPGMRHGRVIRPSAIGATLASVDEAPAHQIAPDIQVVRRGNFLGVVASTEANAIAAARALRASWLPPKQGLMPADAMYQSMQSSPIEPKVLEKTGDVSAGTASAAAKRAATYRMPFQSHGSIGPSCGVADVRGGTATVWSGTQGAYSLREAIATLLDLDPSHVQVVWAEASGCYGHNGADDAAADAALLSQAVGAPVRVQWSRQDEFGWDPKGPAMLMECTGAVDASGAMVAWDYTVTTPTHTTRPSGDRGELVAGQLMGAELVLGTGGGDRNARHSYRIPNNRVAVRWLTSSVLRPSAMRGLGAPANAFAIESFVDELAAAAHADPVEFRLRHLTDPRAVAVVKRVAEISGWRSRAQPNKTLVARGIATGRGIAFAQYETAYTYVATVVNVEVDQRAGTIRVPRAWVAHDCGLIVNPDGLRNQIEGATVQTISRTLKERVRWDHAAVTSVDWNAYPILTFLEVPDSIEIALLNHPEAPVWGAGEPAACTVPGAIANAVYDATGLRLREIPLTAALQNMRVSLSDHRSTTTLDSV